MPNTVLWINNLDLASLDLEVEDVQGLLDAAPTALPELRLPGFAGAFVSSKLGSVEPREITVQVCTVAGQRISAAWQAQLRVRQLHNLCAGGLCEIRAVNEPTLCFAGSLASFIEEHPTPNGRLALLNRRATLRFRCLDPFGYDLGQLAPISAKRSPLWLGNAPSKPVIYIQGPATNPSLIYRNFAGAALCTMGFTITLADGDWLRIDCDTQDITKSVSGSESSGLSAWTTASDGFVVLDLADSDPLGLVGLTSVPAEYGPTLEVTGLSAGGSAEAYYRRAFR